MLEQLQNNAVKSET